MCGGLRHGRRAAAPMDVVDACFAAYGCAGCVDVDASCAFCEFRDVGSCYNASAFPSFCRQHGELRSAAQSGGGKRSAAPGGAAQGE